MSSFSEFFNHSNTLELGDREQRKTADVVEKDLTVEDYSIFDGSHGKTGIVLFKEDPDGFYFSGKVLTDLLNNIDEKGKHEDVVKEGLKIHLYMQKNKKGNAEYVAVKEW